MKEKKSKKCPKCKKGQMIPYPGVAENLDVCNRCGHEIGIKRLF